MTTNNQAEHNEQVAVMVWKRANQHRWPELAFLHAIPNGGKRGKKTAADLKAEGVLSGVSDLMLPVARAGYHGLYLEMKAARGRLSEAQRWWIESMRGQGYFADVAFGAEQATQCLADYLRGSPSAYRYAEVDDLGVSV